MDRDKKWIQRRRQEEYTASISHGGSQSRCLSTDMGSGWRCNTATAMARERNRPDLSQNYRWSTATHSSADREQAYYPDGSPIPGPARTNHEARNRHVRPALSQPASRIHHHKQPNRLTRTRHLRRQPRPSVTVRSPSILPSASSRKRLTGS